MRRWNRCADGRTTGNPNGQANLPPWCESGILSRSLLMIVLMLCAGPGVVAQEQNNSIAVQNQVAQPSQPITTMRYWRIEKGGFPRFLRTSQEGVWPYFEKIGARVVGMWKVLSVVPDDEAGLVNSGYRVLDDNERE